MEKLLNYTGLSYFLEKLKNFFIIKPKTGSAGQVLMRTADNGAEWSSLPSMLTFKGSKPTIEDLPTSGNQIGDVWSVGNQEYFCKALPAVWEQLGPVITTYTEGDNIEITDNQISALGYHYNQETESFTEGNNTISSGLNQHVQGKWNLSNTTSAFIIGNGNTENRSNALTVDWQGNEWISGNNIYTLRVLDNSLLSGSIHVGYTDPKYNYIDVNSTSANVGFPTTEIANFIGVKEVIYHIKNTSGSSIIVSINSSQSSNIDVVNFLSTEVQVGNGKSLELVITFWKNNLISINGGVSL